MPRSAGLPLPRVGWRAQDFVGPVSVPPVFPLFPARVTFWPLPLLPEFPDPTLPPPELAQWTTPLVPSGVVVGVQEPGAGERWRSLGR